MLSACWFRFPAETNFDQYSYEKPNGNSSQIVSTKELIEKEIADLPEQLQRKVYDFAVPLKRNRDKPFNGAALSKATLARDWNSPEEDARFANL